jgi:methionyl-tRNA synthetase
MPRACDHDHWNLKPGNVVECARCGEQLDPEDWAREEACPEDETPRAREVTIFPQTIKPLTHRISNLNLSK